MMIIIIKIIINNNNDKTTTVPFIISKGCLCLARNRRRSSTDRTEAGNRSTWAAAGIACTAPRIVSSRTQVRTPGSLVSAVYIVLPF